METQIPQSVLSRVAKLCDIRTRPIFRYMAEFERTQKRIDLYRMKLALAKGGIIFTDMDMVQLFERMERAGVGKLTVSQLPLHSTFEWGNYRMQDLARAALQELGPISASHRPEPIKGDRIQIMTQVQGEVVAIALPKSFTLDDARNLARQLEAAARFNESRK